MSVLSLRIDEDMMEVIEELISLGLSQNKNQAVILLMRLDMQGAKEIVRRKEVLELLDNINSPRLMIC